MYYTNDRMETWCKLYAKYTQLKSDRPKILPRQFNSKAILLNITLLLFWGEAFDREEHLHGLQNMNVH